MTTLVTFARARLDDDEQTARAAHQPNWVTDGRRGIEYGLDGGWMTDALTTADANHIARHDPARVLAEVGAKRQTVERHAQCGTGVGYCDDAGHGWDWAPGGGCA
ncbi:DUF6221 family protein, partial [Streptomyces sp. NPDC057540]|uniref:DUF6221 family protein n=1 Tax=Streptomyces sp. NPDC057540 TaxID=3346160 RepID=UPI0036BCE26E